MRLGSPCVLQLLAPLDTAPAKPSRATRVRALRAVVRDTGAARRRRISASRLRASLPAGLQGIPARSVAAVIRRDRSVAKDPRSGLTAGTGPCVVNAPPSAARALSGRLADRPQPTHTSFRRTLRIGWRAIRKPTRARRAAPLLGAMNQHLRWLWEFLMRSLSHAHFHTGYRRYLIEGRVTGRPVDSFGLGSGALVPALLPIGPRASRHRLAFPRPAQVRGSVPSGAQRTSFSASFSLIAAPENLPLSSPVLSAARPVPAATRPVPAATPPLPAVTRPVPAAAPPLPAVAPSWTSASYASTHPRATIQGENAENLHNHPSRIQGPLK